MAPFLGTFPGPDTYPGPGTFPGGPPAQVKVPPNYVDGNLITAADLNPLGADIDALSAIVLGKSTGLATTTGQPPAGRAAAKVHTQSPQSITTGTTQIVGWEAVDYDTDNQFDLQRNTRMTVWLPGWYRVITQIAFASASGNERAANIHVNGTATANIVASTNTCQGGAASQRMQVSAYLLLARNSHIFVSAYQASGAALDLNPVGAWGSWLSMRWDSPP